jgi:hypothetical protein
VGADVASALDASQMAGPIEAMRRVLIREGFELVENEAEAQFNLAFRLRSELRTPAGGGLGDFHTAYVEGIIAARDANGALVNETRVERTKGVQLNSDAALRLALSNAAESIEKSLGKKVADTLH